MHDAELIETSPDKDSEAMSCKTSRHWKWYTPTTRDGTSPHPVLWSWKVLLVKGINGVDWDIARQIWQRDIMREISSPSGELIYPHYILPRPVSVSVIVRDVLAEARYSPDRDRWLTLSLMLSCNQLVCFLIQFTAHTRGALMPIHSSCIQVA